MSIRRTFLLLVAPLFLLLAGVNGALLYMWERAEAERGLANQAIAAAVTTAAFADASDDLARALSDPVRAATFREAGRQVEGLHGLYLVNPDGETIQIAGRPSAYWPGKFETPKAPLAAAIRADPTGLHVATGLAPIAGGGFVIAQINAEPLFAQVRGLQQLVIGLVVAAGLIGLILALVIARVIVRELGRNSAAIDAIRADTPLGDVTGFAIRETQDLALAVRLMRTSVGGRLARGRHELARRDRARDEARAAAAHREIAFPPLAADAAGAAVAARILGEAPAGAFYALSVSEDRAALAVGICEGANPSDALAAAVAARRFLEARLASDGAAAIDRAKAAFGLARVAWRAWIPGEAGLVGLALVDGDKGERIEAYLARADGLTPMAVVDDLVTLLRPDGVVAVVRSGAGA